MNELLKDIQKEQSYTRTENGALALNTTSDDLVNLFAVSGALREREDEEIIELFAKAMVADPLLATKMAFYTRDIRGGLGERRTGRLMFRYLAERYPDILTKNIDLIAEYGRYDDLIDLMDLAPKLVVEIVRKQLAEDLKAMKEKKAVSLLAKWLPSVNTSNKETVKKGRFLAKSLKMSEKEYRKTLSGLRKYLNVVEVNLSAKDYEAIVYPEVPSKAMNNYRNAFRRNDAERFTRFLDDVSKGKAKINAGTLYPYDIVEKYFYGRGGDDQVLEEQWKALPNYVEGENRFLIMADVSGSMFGRPLATSVGLALYFAERNKGPFANTFMTFSATPKLVEIKGDTVFQKLQYIQSAEWGMNTDLEAAFRLILYTAGKYKLPASELPESIVVITDMEFDECVSGDWLFYDSMKQQFEAAGYQIPNIVFWNVNSRHSVYHASFDCQGVQLASGQSASVFENLIKGVNLTPYEYMLSVLNNERYEKISV